MSNAFIFDGFLSMGDMCFSIYISKNREVVLIDVLFLPECWGIILSGALERTHC